MKNTLDTLRWSNIWITTVVACGLVGSCPAAVFPVDTAILLIASGLAAVGLLWQVLRLERTRILGAKKQSDQLLVFILRLTIASLLSILFMNLFLVPASGWDLLDFWAPLAKEISRDPQNVLTRNLHQPLFLPAIWSVWSGGLEALGSSSLHLGAVLFWITLVFVICVLSYTIISLVGGSTNIGLAAIIVLLTTPLYENHAALFGYTEPFTLLFILALFGNVIAYRVSGDVGWLLMTLTCATALSYTRNTGVLFAFSALLPLLILSVPKSVARSFFLTLATLIAIISVATLREGPSALNLQDGVFYGDITECPPDSSKPLYLRLYGVGQEYDNIRGSAFLETTVISHTEQGRRKFVLPSPTVSPEAVWGIRVQCKGERGDRFKATATHFLPVAESTVVLSENIVLFLGHDRYVVMLGGRIFRIEASMSNITGAIFQAVFMNSSFGLLPIFIMLALPIALRINADSSRYPLQYWWGCYLRLFLMTIIIIFASLYFALPYYRHNAASELDTVGSRTLLPLLVSAFVGCAAWVSGVIECSNKNGR